jgi:hypothetical protein
MDGPRHYQEAEQLLRAAGQTSRGADQAAAALLIAQAQVHAMLAVAAAAATNTTRSSEEAWAKAWHADSPIGKLL